MHLDRRRVLGSIAATAVGVGSRLEAGASLPFSNRRQSGWEWTGGSSAAFSGGLRTDDGYLLVGETVRTEWPREGWAVRLTDDGSTTWDEVYRSPPHQAWRERENDPDDVGGPHYEDGFETAVPDGDDGFVLVGWTYADSPAARQGWVVNVDASGAIRWNRQLEIDDESVLFHSLADAARIDDRILAVGVGTTGTGMLGGNGLLLELADDGSVAWWSAFASVEKEELDPRRDAFRSIVPHGDGYLLVGRAQTEEDGSRGWAVRIADDGSVDWRNQYWFGQAVENQFADGVPYGDGALLVGTADDDGWAVAVDERGDVLDHRTYAGATITCAVPGEPPVLGGHRNGRHWAAQYDTTVVVDFESPPAADDVSSEFRSIVPTDDGDPLFVGRRQEPDADVSSGWAIRGTPPFQGNGGGGGDNGNGDDRSDDDSDDLEEHHLLVGSYSRDHTGQYRFEASGPVRRTDHAGDAPFDHGSVTVGDEEDEIDGRTVTGGVSGGGDAYVVSGPLESFRLDRGGDHVFAFLDGAPLDEWTRGNAPTHLALTGGDPDGHVLEYSFAVTGSVARTGRAHEAPIDDDLVTVDPEDVVDGQAVEGTLAGGNDAYYVSGELERFRIDDCGHESVGAWIDGVAVDPCALTE